MSEPPEAQEVVLRKLRPLAPPFHRHIARSKLLGQTCRVGDRVVVYEVVATVPGGDVRVTPETILRFE
ncbi:MAG TPA: hypothetical protein PLE19_21020 [Planctomycetota bacterium]|nr:hypothetical protein [Planctomycetota bacterium]HRR79878.1 hypothetical protein [Planctomycetota bacterium]HRT96525.1 hypothetical protein [Planctomycetota bacterium]